MKFDEAANILWGQEVEVDRAAFIEAPGPTGQYVRCGVRFQCTRDGIGGWADILNTTELYVTPKTGEQGRYVPLDLVRKIEERHGQS